MKKLLGILLLALLALSYAQYQILHMEVGVFQEDLYIFLSLPVQALIFAALFSIQSLVFFTNKVNGAVEFRRNSMMSGFLREYGIKRFCTAFWGFAFMTLILAAASLYLAVLASRLPMVGAEDWLKIGQFVIGAFIFLSWVFLLFLGLHYSRIQQYELEEGQSLQREKKKGYSLLFFSGVTGLYALLVPLGMTPMLIILFLLGGTVTIFVMVYPFYWAGKKFLLWFEKTETGKALKHVIERSCPVVKPATE